ncbi:MAG: type I restriction enzyme HsdR N-terminal domain-containing protein [Prevotellaceae bacterium]|nr:type I restriction enzyme HsdR N-terminal domain-containing protein [Prevotellaceae bacterium]
MNPPRFEHRIRNEGKTRMIFDPVRRKYVTLTPEEWVRQNFLQYLIQTKKVPKSLIRVEMQLELNGLTKRSDIVVHDRKGKPLLAVECKAPEVKITGAAFEQLSRYNLQLNVPYLIVTNGVSHFFHQFSEQEQRFVPIDDIPDYNDLADSD